MIRQKGSNRATWFYILISLIAIVGPALSEERSDEIVRLSLFGQQLESGKAECIERSKGLDVRAIQERNPSLFLAITPSSKVWAGVEVAYIRYVTKLCLPSSLPKCEDLASSTVSRHLSSEEKQQTLEFLRSPAGQKFSIVSQEISQQVNAAMSLELVEVQKEAWLEYEGEILKLKSAN